MRIPVKAQYKGYIPALNPFSKDKLVWFKPTPDTKLIPDGLGIPANTVTTILTIVAGCWAFWIRNRAVQTRQYGDLIIYNELGHDKYILLYVIAAIFGVLGYFWALFVYDFKKTKKYSKSESIRLYKKAPLITKDKEYQEELRQARNKWWWAIPLSILMAVAPFLVPLIRSSSSFFAGALFGISLFLTACFVYVGLYYPTLFFARKYMDRRFSVKPKKTK